MRTTVGPLPPAVYWRRRAVVLGALLLAVVILLWSCVSAADKPGVNGAKPPVGVPATPTPAVELTLNPSESAEVPPGGGGPAGAPSEETTGPNVPAGAPAGAGSASAPPVAPAATGPCTDAEMLVTPVPTPASAQRGQSIELRLKIKNVSARTCSRDVGADVQEVYIKQGAQKVWSSDACGIARGSGQDMQQFAPNLEQEYRVTWNGRDVTRCTNAQAGGPVVPAGEYQVIGRLSQRLSTPVKLVLTG